MKLTPPSQFAKTFALFILILMFQQVSGKAFSQQITFTGEKVSMKDVFESIKKQTGFVFFYRNNDLVSSRPVTVHLKEVPVNIALDAIFNGQLLSYHIEGNTVIVTKAVTKKETQQNVSSGIADPQFANNHTTRAGQLDMPTLATASPREEIRGTVIDTDGNPVEGATITIRGTLTAVTSGGKGIFKINADKGDVLIISHVSFITRSITVGDENRLVITLQANVNQLEQITITGYTGYSRSKSPSATGFVSAGEINEVPMSTVDQILQGRVAGLNVISGSGQPGQNASVIIRGIGSISGTTTPLYVMDGIPIESNYFQTINPQDIESVTVLKDASAKSLYGSRGSNGVIVITTKKGQRGSLHVGYSSQYGFSNLTQPRFEMMDTRERLKFEEEVGSETGRDIGPGWTYSPLNPAYTSQSADWQHNADHILDSLGNMNTNWRDLFFHNGRFMQQQLSLSGGNEHIQVYNSLGLWKEDGIVRRTGLDRYSLRSNVNINYGRFTGGVDIALGFSNSGFTYNEGGTSVGTPMASVYYALPYEYPYTPDGVLHATDDVITFLDTREGSRGIDVLYGTSTKTQQFKTILSVNLGYEILPGLKATTRAGTDLRNSTVQNFINPLSYIGSRTFGQKGSFGEGFRRNYNVISTSGLTFSKTIDKHDFEVSGFFEYLYNHFKSFSYTGYGLDDRLPETPAGITVSQDFLPDISGSRTASALASYMGVGRYTYNDKYTITASYRYDGATAVAPKNRWHGFYSFGANWDAKRENFLKSSELISVLRFRASYGQTASPFGGDFLYLPTYSVGSTYGGQAAINPSAIGNPDFDWEYVDEFNAGFDLALFGTQRVKFIVDFYNRITRNMFINQPLSATSGASEAPLSTGKMRNRGIEFNVSGDIVRNNSLRWNIGVNGGYNQNRILHVTDVTDELTDGDTRVIKVGFPYGTYTAPQWAGVDPANGDALYYNRDGSITNVYNEEEQTVPNSGSMYPKFTGGISTSVTWNGFTLDALLSFVTGVNRWNNIDFYIETERFMTSNQSKRMLYDRWKKPGDHAILQRVDVPRSYTSKDIQDAKFMRLRNVRLSYNLPASLIGGTKIFRTISVFAQGQNLLTWTKWRGLDPENDRVYGRFEYPNARTYTAGLNVNF